MIPFAALKLQNQFRSQSKVKLINPIGADTETDSRIGKVELLALETGEHVHPRFIDDVFDLLFQKKYKKNVYVFYNLKYDVQAILKLTHPEVWQQLWNEGSTTIGPYEMELIPWKLFKVKKDEQTITMFDMWQFFIVSLDNAAKRFLGESKIDTVDRTNLQNFHDPEVIRYCIHDAYLVGSLARFLLKTHRKHFPESPPSLISKASMAEKHFTTTCKIPTINNVMFNFPKYVRYSYYAYKGGWFSAYKKGRFKNVYVYDINSAYPYAMASLPDLSKGKFYFFERSPYVGAALGWYKCRVNIKQSNLHSHYSPICHNHKGVMYYPSGKFTTFLTKLEYKILSKYYDIKILSGVDWIPDEIEYPFKKEINRLYEWKRNETDPILKSLIKIILNSIYGKTIQKIPLRDDPNYRFKTGNLFCPFYASYITAGCRMQIFQTIVKHSNPENWLVMISTDSIMATEKLNIPLDNNLGGWSLEKQGHAMVLGSGVYSIRDDSNNSVYTKNRGFKPITGLNLFEIDGLLDGINPAIKLTVRDHVSLATALIQKTPEKLNLITEKTKKLNLNFDKKRLWLDKFSDMDSFARQINSRALDINLI